MAVASAATSDRTGARTYAGRTGAQRRTERRELLLRAAGGLVRADGLAAVGVRPVCRAAGLTERYFYESFAGADELLVAVFDAQLAGAAELVAAAVRGAGPRPEATVRAAVGAFVDLLSRDPLPGRLLVESAGHSVLAPRRRTAVDTFADLVVATGTDLVGPAADARAGRRSRRFAVALVGGFHELVTQWIEDPAGTAAEELVDDVVALFLASFRHAGPPG